ncbi:MAG: ABC transporter substrate-binding protein, partial [Candidatus Kariarchaeaceae archaeon]
MKRSILWTITTALIFTLLTSSYSLSDATSLETDDTTGVFYISLLSPNTNPARNAWAAVVAEELPKAGIGIETHESLGWDAFGARTFLHERDESSAHYGAGRIPLHDEGGYDIFFVGLGGEIDYDPATSYSNRQFSPVSNNFASYDNDDISTLIAQYTSEHDPARRAKIATQIQQMAYDDQPYINIVKTAELWAYDAGWTKLTESDLLFFETTNYADGWKNIEHDTRSDIVYAHPFELEEFSPFVAKSYIANQYTNPIYPGLYERDPHDSSFAYKPVIAADMPIWDVTHTIATIDINENAKFSTGAAVDVYDVVNSFHMHMTPEISVGNYADLTTHILDNDSVRVIDSDTLEITLKAPYYKFNQLFSVPILDKDEIGTPSQMLSYGGISAIGPLGDGPDHTDFNTEAWKYHGAGPFTYNEDAMNHGIDAFSGNVKIVANPDYWRGIPKLDSIQFNKYDSKEAAIAALDSGWVQIIDGDFNVELYSVLGESSIRHKIISDFVTQMMVVNMDHPILGTGVDTPLGKDDPTRAEEAARYVRQAISHLVP